MSRCCRRAPGYKLLDEFASSRTTSLQLLLQAEASKAAQEITGEQDCRLHDQCVRDFDRAEYVVDARCFAAGAVARTAVAGSEQECDAGQALVDGLEHGRAELLACLSKECGHCATLTYVASALTSQLSLAHLGSACFSGPHSYALPSGYTKPRYGVRQRGSDIEVKAMRISEGFPSFSLPGEEPHTISTDSHIRQEACMLLGFNTSGDVKVEVEDSWEEMKLLWPNRRVVAVDGLELNFRSPPLQTSTAFVVEIMWLATKPWRYLAMTVGLLLSFALKVATLPFRLPRSALTAVIAHSKRASKRHKLAD